MSLLSDDPLSGTEDPSSPIAKSGEGDGEEGTAGVYLGIHNVFATVPQFLATGVSMVVFGVLEPGVSPELGGGVGGVGEEEGKVVRGRLAGTAVCLAIGAVFQVVAAAQSLKMRRG